MSQKILLIATKEPEYSRIKMLRQALAAEADVTCLFSAHSSYAMRVIDVCWRFLWMPKKEFDLVVVGFFAQLIFPFVRLLWRGKLMSDCYISLYDSLIFDRAKFRPGGMVASFVHWLDGTLLAHSERALTDTKAHAEYLAQEFSVDEGIIVPVPISADEAIFPFDPGPHEPYRGEGTFEVFFFGAFIPLQGTDVIVEAAALLADEPVRIHFFGEGQTYAETKSMADGMGLENVVFHGWKPVEEIPEFARTCHLILGIFGRTEKAARVIPNKVFEALSLGRPVITGDSPAVCEFLTDGEDILLVPLADPAALAEKIKWAQANHEEAIRIGHSGHQVFAEKLSPECVKTLVGQVVREILESGD